MRRETVTAGAALLLLGLSVFGFFRLQRRAGVADIVSDEAAWDFLDSLARATEMKVAFLQDGLVARVAGEDDGAYICAVQDTFSVPKTEARTELWSAADGKGIVFLKHPGSLPAYSEPDPSSGIVMDLTWEEGRVPDTYPCLGLDDGWFRIDAGGTQACIRAEHVCWDSMDTF